MDLPKIGILGGGQLGRMIIQEALDFNLEVAVLDPDASAPCKPLVDDFTAGSLVDFDTVYQFGQSCDVVTVEIENVNVEALEALEKEGKRVFPQPGVLATIQDKRKQKVFYKANRIPTADFLLTENAQEVREASHFLPAVHKLGKEGYDGKGVQVIREEADLVHAFDKPGVLETLVPFEKEISVIVARNESGEVETFPVVELSYHPEKNLVEFLFAPATVSEEVEQKARQLAIDVITKLDMVGLLAVEMFLLPDQTLLVNEVAPRVHNSGHHSIEGNITSQFEQHLRAILNWPLGNTSLVRPTAMVNLLGEEGYTGKAKFDGLSETLAMEDVHIHFYGKKETRPFRKMGHVTIGDNDLKSLKEKAMKVKQTLKIIA